LVPAIYPLRELASAGCVISDGASISDAYRHCGVYAGRIGEKPADLLVLQTTKFDFVINLITAKELGLEIPPMLLARAGQMFIAAPASGAQQERQ
jgi:putative ABC transport system substrate-binding protein